MDKLVVCGHVVMVVIPGPIGVSFGQEYCICLVCLEGLDNGNVVFVHRGFGSSYPSTVL